MFFVKYSILKLLAHVIRAFMPKDVWNYKTKLIYYLILLYQYICTYFHDLFTESSKITCLQKVSQLPLKSEFWNISNTKRTDILKRSKLCFFRTVVLDIFLRQTKDFFWNTRYFDTKMSRTNNTKQDGCYKLNSTTQH